MHLYAPLPLIYSSLVLPSMQILGKSVWNLTEEQQKLLLPPLDPYDNPLVLSLKDFVDHPIAQELLHNGQAFQVRRFKCGADIHRNLIYLIVWVMHG